MNPRRHKRKGVSPVIATVILSAVVITIGGSLWSYTQSATTVIANDYIDGVMELMKTALERFTVEYVCNNSDGTVLHVWIYNYGDINVTADVYAFVGNQNIPPISMTPSRSPPGLWDALTSPCQP